VTDSVVFKSDVDVQLVDYMGNDKSIAAAARVSTKGWTEEGDEASGNIKGLINFLMRDRHGTPFEHNSLTFRISAPLFVFYEMHRHRVGWSYNEESARYRELDPVFYVPRHDRALRQVGKPGAYTFEPGDDEQHSAVLWTHQSIAECAWHDYQEMLSKGVAREVARNVLPVSIFKTMYATANVRSLLSFLSLRWAHPESKVPTFPLHEIELVAKQMDAKARHIFPVTFQTFDKNGRIAP
jgi:thymidylate synthase (FAD)